MQKPFNANTAVSIITVIWIHQVISIRAYLRSNSFIWFFEGVNIFFKLDKRRTALTLYSTYVQHKMVSICNTFHGMVRDCTLSTVSHGNQSYLEDNPRKQNDRNKPCKQAAMKLMSWKISDEVSNNFLENLKFWDKNSFCAKNNLTDEETS